jgi:L,D-transpeptidase catalytic domain
MKVPFLPFFILSSLILTPLKANDPKAETPPAEKPQLPAAPEPVEAILRLQIYLDSKLFCPAKVDGRPGEFTNKALNRYQRSQSLPETSVEAHALDLSTIIQLYTEYTIRQEDLKFIGSVPGGPAAQSQRKYLPYSSLLEFLSERFHTSPELIEWLNKPNKMSKLKVGDVVKVPNVAEPFQIETLTPISSLPEVPEYQGKRVIKVDTREKLLGVFEGEKLLCSLPITPGSGSLATPPGSWTIIGISQLPTFRWDKSVLNYGVRSDQAYELPIGPNNPVGVMWIGLSRAGIGIHGTNQPQTIGRSSSHGCMRTANWDVIRLSKMISKGMTVVIEGPRPTPRPPMVASKKAPSTKNKTAANTAPAAPPTATAKKGFRWFWQKS